MGVTRDLGHRIELVPMDPHCSDITLALYRQSDGSYLVHTYSSRPGAAERASFVASAMSVLGGMEWIGGSLRHRCGDLHQVATRRLFLEAAKIPTGEAVAAKPLSMVDRKTGLSITVHSEGAGLYRIESADSARARQLMGGFQKLAGLNEGSFPCGCSHDELIALLLPRAINVRAAIREEEMAAARGVLAAPSAQK